MPPQPVTGREQLPPGAEAGAERPLRRRRLLPQKRLRRTGWEQGWVGGIWGGWAPGARSGP